MSENLKNKKIRSAFSIHPLLVGGNPYTTTSIYSLIHFLERKWGVFFCMGGTGKLVEELTNLMKRYDINIETNKNLKSVEHKDSVAYKAITECGKEYKFDNYDFDHIHVCLSPQYTPKNHWHYFSMFINTYEHFHSKDATIENKKFEHEFRYRKLGNEILH